MVKLDVTMLRYLAKEDFRILTAVEMGMKNHELVPGTLVGSISSLKHGGVGKILNELCRHKLLCYERGKRFDGYRLTYLGYDYLALNALRSRGVLSQVGNQIGVGKESDVYVAADDDNKRYALKIHRLGRTCFRNVTDKRDYQRQGKKVHNWIYMSRLAALREFAFMKALHGKGLPVPTPIDCNRHCVVMELIQGTLLNNVSLDMIPDKGKLYDKLMNLLLSLANDYGVIHGDFNEFNIMISDDTLEPILIDFPQMVPVSHRFAETYFERDVTCVVDFFRKRFEYITETVPSWENDVAVSDEPTGIIAELAGDKELELDGDVDIETENLVKDTSDEAIDAEEDQVPFEEAKEHLDGPVDALNGESDDVVPELVDVNQSQDVIASDPEDGNDRNSEYSSFSTTSRCTFAPVEVKSKLRREKQKVTKRKEIYAASRNVKGDSNAVRRKRNDDTLTIKDDLRVHAVDPF